VGASALLRAARSSLGAAEANLQNVVDRQGAGAATDLDRERASANVERTRQDLADAELALAGRALETLSGVSPTPAEEFPSDDLHDEGELEPWLALAGRTPQDRVAQAAERAALDARSAAKAAYLPVLSGSALERFTNATGFAHHVAFYALQLTLTWRLDYSTVANERAQAAALEVQKVRVERTARAVADAIFEAYRRIQAGLAKSRAARAQSSAAARAAGLAADRYSVGVATQLDVTEAQRDAYASDATRIQADADLAYARVALRLAANTALDRRNP
jgi:outer membrane protein TolC